MQKKAYFDKINHDLSDQKISTKKWWSISKRLCGGNEVTSIPAIVEDGVTVSKTELRFRHVDTTELEIKELNSALTVFLLLLLVLLIYLFVGVSFPVSGS